MPTLVVVAGPIAAGKSTLADLLARAVATPERTAVVVDLDGIAFTQRSAPDQDRFWGRAATVAGATVRTWFDAGADVVVAHGPFFESDGYARLLGGLSDGVVVRHVLLRVSTDVALARAAADTSRGLSKDPDFLRATHERFHGLEPSLPHPDAVFDTGVTSATEIVEELVRSLHLDACPVGCDHVDGRRQGS